MSRGVDFHAGSGKKYPDCREMTLIEIIDDIAQVAGQDLQAIAHFANLVNQVGQPAGELAGLIAEGLLLLALPLQALDLCLQRIDLVLCLTD